MSAFPIAEAPIFNRLHALVRDHNEGQTSCRYKVRNGVKNTLLTIMNEYIKEFRRVEKIGLMADSDQLPSLHTNRFALSALTGSGKRTIYGHIMLLLATGFLTEKQNHGWQKNFEVWINPWILFGDCYPRPAIIDHIHQKNTTNGPDNGQNSPSKSTLETPNNCIISGVDLSITSTEGEKRDSPTNPRVRVDTLEDITLETAGAGKTASTSVALETAPGGARPSGPRIPVQANDNGGQRAGNGLGVTTLKPAGTVPTTPNGGQWAGDGPGVTTQAPTGTVPTNPVKVVNPFLLQYRKTLVLSFWQLAKEKLWTGKTFSSDYTSQILNRIWNDVFWKWEGATTKELCNSLYMSRVQQLEKAEKYIRKQGWSSVIPPIKYFSLAFHNEQLAKGEKGNFHYTTAWQLADEKAREKLEHNNILHQAVQSVLNEKAPRGLKGGALMSKLQLYQYWQDRLHRQSTLDVVVRFNEQISSMVNISPALKQAISTL